MLRSAPTGAALLALALSACSSAFDSPTQPAEGSQLLIQPALIPSAADATALPINRIRTVTMLAPGGAVLSEDVQDVSPTADEWEITVVLPGYDEVTVVVLLYLIHVDGSGTEEVQFSGRTDPITVEAGEPVTPDIPIVRGPLANLNTTAVTITSVPTLMREGETTTVQATAETSGAEDPEVFWASLDPAVLSVTDGAVGALSIGTGRVVASAGAFADTVLIEVLTSDVTPPSIAEPSPAPGAAGVAPTTDVRVLFSEEIDPSSVTPATVYLRDPQGADVAATLSVSGALVTLTPDAPLDTITTYTVTVGAVADLVGNVHPDLATWSFTTASAAVLLSSFDPGLGSLVAVAYEPIADHLYIYDDFATGIVVYSTAGAPVGNGLPLAGIASNDIDLDFTEVAMTLGTTQVPGGTLLIHNGETSPGTLYAMESASGILLDSLAMQTSGQPVGGAVHSERTSFFSLSWNNDLIHEVDLTTGAATATFSPAPAGSSSFGIFYGDIEADVVTGNLLIVSSEQNRVRIMSPDGVYIRDVDVGSLGISSMSGIAWDSTNRVAWIVTTTGMVYEVGGLL